MQKFRKRYRKSKIKVSMFFINSKQKNPGYIARGKIRTFCQELKVHRDLLPGSLRCLSLFNVINCVSRLFFWNRFFPQKIGGCFSSTWIFPSHFRFFKKIFFDLVISTDFWVFSNATNFFQGMWCYAPLCLCFIKIT